MREDDGWIFPGQQCAKAGISEKRLILSPFSMAWGPRLREDHEVLEGYNYSIKQ